MTPSKYELREAIETIDHELSFLEVALNLTPENRRKRIARWQNVRTVLLGLLKDVAESEGTYHEKDNQK